MIEIYPKPGQVGGKLIRNVIAFMREQGVELPITSHILIAVSGGSDSLSLAHLLIRYGRRVVTKEKIRLLHINHGWRGKESEKDFRFVKKFAEQWSVPFYGIKLQQQKIKNESLENLARKARKTVYFDFIKNKKIAEFVFTAHHLDDLAETVLWRIFTGKLKTHGGGILFKTGVEVRPLLTSCKKDLQKYLNEEKLLWREDATNHEGRFLRSKMRLRLMPEIEKLFPRATRYLLEQAFEAQKKYKEAQKELKLN